MRGITCVLLLAISACSPDDPSTEAVHDRSAIRPVKITGGDVSTEITYDAAGTHIVKQVLSTTAAGTVVTDDFTYSGDHLASMTSTDSNGTTTSTFGYEGERLTMLSSTGPGGTFQTEYTYDSMGGLATVATGSATSTYTYDSDRRLSTIAAEGQTWRFTYDPSGRLSTLADGAGDHYTIEYDAMDRASRITSMEGQEFDMTYDERGRLHTLTMNFGLPGPPDQLTYEYADGTLENMSLRTGIDGNYELRNFLDLEGHLHSHPDPRQLDPEL